MSSSSEPGRARVLHGAVAAAAHGPELRTGAWTRLGSDAVLGDAVTEDALAVLADAARTAASAQGYAVGWAQGRRAAADQATAAAAAREREAAGAEARRAAAHDAALARLDTVTRTLGESVARVSTEIEDRALGLARELTSLLVGHELRHSPDTGADAVRRALALLGDEHPATIRLSPADAGSEAAADLATRRLRVVADAALADGDVLVETDTQILDARISAALERVREVLS